MFWLHQEDAIFRPETTTAVKCQLEKLWQVADVTQKYKRSEENFPYFRTHYRQEKVLTRIIQNISFTLLRRKLTIPTL